MESTDVMPAATTAEIAWPKRHNLFGLEISATHYQEVVDALIFAAETRTPAIASFLPVHGVVTAARNAQYREAVNKFQIVAPDGQPVRWALNHFHNTGLQDRVYGPEITLRLCAAAATRGLKIYLYGSYPQVLEKLQAKLIALFPNLQIVGAESPPFRPLTAEEDHVVAQRINASGAQLLFLGLGLPRQDEFAFRHRSTIYAVQCCVGAAFDFHAGTKKMAPQWMQKRGLEWLFRLSTEPRRLGKRYLVTNSLFVYLVARKSVGGVFRSKSARAA